MCNELKAMLEAVRAVMRTQAEEEYMRMFPRDKRVPAPSKWWWSWFEGAVVVHAQ